MTAQQPTLADPPVVDIDDLSKSTAVEVRAASSALVVSDEWSDVDDGDLSPSDAFRIPLYQLNRKADGGFLNEDTGDVEHEIYAVLMNKVNTRAWWPQQFGKGDAAPACRSDNGVEANPERSPALAEDWTMPTKDLRGGTKPTGVCATCPNSQWDGDDPAPCGESIEFLAFVPTAEGAGRFARLRFSGMGFGPARDYWQSFKTRMPRRVPIAFVTKISLEPKPTDNGTFLVPKFTRERELIRSDAQPILDARSQMTGEWTEQLATDDRPTVTVDTDGDAGVEYENEEPF